MSSKFNEVLPTFALTVYAPHFFMDAAFVQWLNGDGRKFTWHEGGTPDEWSDVVVSVDPGLGGEGSDSDMPDHLWAQVVEVCRQHFQPSNGPHILVRLVNQVE